MEPFVLKILKRLRKEAPRKFKDLRISCDELIGNIYYIYLTDSCTFMILYFILSADFHDYIYLRSLISLCYVAALTEKENANGGESQETDADQYFEPLEMACQTRQPRLMEISLDSIHYLIGTK